MISIGEGRSSATPAPATQLQPPAMPKARPSKNKRQPFNLKTDKYHRHGALLVAAEQAPEAVERLLAVLRLLLSLLCDILRPSEEPSDAPVTILGQHYISHRELSGYADGSADRVHIQEICSLDAEEKPRQLPLQGAPLAMFHLTAQPQAKAKSKRLGRELYLKASLQASGRVAFLRHNEEYECGLPDLVMNDPLAGQCTPDFKGELTARCEATGLQGTLVFKGKDGSVKGTLEQLSASGYAKVGTFSGLWNDKISVLCPSPMDMEGLVHDAGAVKPSISRSLDLLSLGPVQLPRLWSCLHDACMYNDAGRATGGKAADRLSHDLARRLKSLSYEPIRTRDVTTAGPAGAAGGGPSGGAGGPPAASAGGSSADDSDYEEAEAAGKQGDTRSVPPCFKVEKAAGKVLRWQLAYTVVNMPNTFTAGQQLA